MFGTVNDSSDTHNLLNWKKYAHNWDTFIKIFPTFVFDKDSYVNLSVMSHGSSKFTNLKTNDILTNQGEGNTNSLYNISIPYSAGRYHFKEIFDLNIWHDNENIYFKWFLCGIEGGSEYTINLNNINFINIMN
ncbi:hypothetical protein [Spiroplasma endosymbiont of Amphimallon solstitiale]|uniref:hypothetical protein n=1 Tax=Spiroplasma endosymbiont of Amphimallon solstitiale TaxID=3066288 RepID=UPI00313EB0EC